MSEGVAAAARYRTGTPVVLGSGSSGGGGSNGGVTKGRGGSKGAAAAGSAAIPPALAPTAGGSTGTGAACVFLRDAAHASELAAAAGKCRDPRLGECLRHGIGYHSAAESPADRALVEGLFLSGSLPVLCITSTLALGVNLPAHLVMIKSTQAWRGAGQGYREYPKAHILQVRHLLAIALTRERSNCTRFLLLRY